MPSLTLDDYVDISPAAAVRQWREIVKRPAPPQGQHQSDFLPVETLLCLAGMYLVNGSQYGSSTAHKAPTPVPELAKLFKRPATSITSKMANLEGSRPRGSRLDRPVATALWEEPDRLAAIYRMLLATARDVAITKSSLPDFLGLEGGGSVYLLGQDELAESGARSRIEDDFETGLRHGSTATEREALMTVRVGQHHFARDVLHNCGDACVFCGFVVTSAPPSGLLRASHIKPWRDSTHAERLNVANGLAACPMHDAAFDTGLLTVERDLTIRQSEGLRKARAQNATVEGFFGSPPMYPRIKLPGHARPIDLAYLDWHKLQVFVA